MKRLSIIAMLAGVVGAANAVTFSNSVISSVPATSSSEIVSGNSIKRVLDNFVLNANIPDGNVAWVFDFDASTGPDPVLGYTSVELIVRGTLSGGTGSIPLGTEQVRCLVCQPPAIVGYGLMSTTMSESVWERSIVIPFSQTVVRGQAQKDLYFHFETVTGGGQMQVTEIEQRFTPVPEPATLIGLAVGSLLVARRRRK